MWLYIICSKLKGGVVVSKQNKPVKKRSPRIRPFLSPWFCLFLSSAFTLEPTESWLYWNIFLAFMLDFLWKDDLSVKPRNIFIYLFILKKIKPQNYQVANTLLPILLLPPVQSQPVNGVGEFMFRVLLWPLYSTPLLLPLRRSFTL